MDYRDPNIFDDAVQAQSPLDQVRRYVSHSRVKRIFDIIFSLAFLVMILPLLFVICAALKLNGAKRITEFRPVIGREGVEFNVLSFAADRETSLGRWLWASGMSALPQLFNVLLGHMSLVGPKPLQISEFGRLKNTVSLYMTVRPGLTGLWYVSDERTLGAVAQTRLDRIYIKTGTFLMDLMILFRTPFVLLRLA